VWKFQTVIHTESVAALLIVLTLTRLPLGGRTTTRRDPVWLAGMLRRRKQGHDDFLDSDRAVQLLVVCRPHLAVASAARSTTAATRWGVVAWTRAPRGG